MFVLMNMDDTHKEGDKDGRSSLTFKKTGSTPPVFMKKTQLLIMYYTHIQQVISPLPHGKSSAIKGHLLWAPLKLNA